MADNHPNSSDADFENLSKNKYSVRYYTLSEDRFLGGRFVGPRRLFRFFTYQTVRSTPINHYRHLLLNSYQPFVLRNQGAVFLTMFLMYFLYTRPKKVYPEKV